jgi:hypothetical protein
MSMHQKIFAILAAFGISCTIFSLVKNGKLKEEYSWLWLLTSVVMIILVFCYDILLVFTQLIGAVMPTTTLFVFSIIFIMFICLHFAVIISRLANQIKNLAQKLSLMEAELEAHRLNQE